ncbi:YchJ family protein [Algicola sagamiensis]|uniref:YchJ family protein n=1 Tax=Algicola sagamiensis TaxID=163869 RepID=UPI00036A485F|nr:YchJ family protein [Algicola sagamiensis]
MQCPCCSHQSFHVCCQPLIEKQQLATTPEALMRSRYSAYVLKNAAYIHATYAPEMREQHAEHEILDWAEQVAFVSLNVIESTYQSQQGIVEFIAQYIWEDKLHTLHERSTFRKEGLHWFYVNGDLFPEQSTKIQRNDPCPCGSQKKFKKCHG